MTPEEYYRELHQKRDELWERLLADAEKGKHLPKEALAQVIFEFGLESATPAAVYVAKRVAREIKMPRGNVRGPRKETPSEEWLRWFYAFELEELELLKKTDPKKYDATYGNNRVEVAAASEDPAIRAYREAKGKRASAGKQTLNNRRSKGSSTKQRRPTTVARELVAKRFDIKPEILRKLPKKRGG